MYRYDHAGQLSRPAKQHALPAASGHSEIERYTPPSAPVGHNRTHQLAPVPTPGYQPAIVASAYGQTPAHQQRHARPEPPAHQQQPPAAAPAHQPPPPSQQPTPPASQPPPPPAAAYQRPSGHRPPQGYRPPAPPADVVTAGPPEPANRRSGTTRKVALIVAAALVVCAGASSFAADAWAKGRACDAVKHWSGSSSGRGGGSDGSDGSAERYLPTVAQVDDLESALNLPASLLFFHGDLRAATHGLSNGAAAAKSLIRSGKLANPDDQTLTQVVALAGSLDTDTRMAERACGLAETSSPSTTA